VIVPDPADSAKATFTPDLAGDYQVRLVVRPEGATEPQGAKTATLTVSDIEEPEEPEE
jgi:hypothetical protein